METIKYYSKWAAKCAKADVVATLVAVNGKRYESSNFILSPKVVCPRGDMPSGVGYALCKSECMQVGHAEENVIYAAKRDTIGSTIYVRHSWICDNCQRLARDAGVKEIIIGEPPDATT